MNKSDNSYHYFENFLSAYLHQDYEEVSGSLIGAIDDFLASEPRYLALGLVADIERFLAESGSALLNAFNQTFPYAFHIGDNDSEAQMWLDELAKLLKQKMAL